jgi:hypothetical protein
LGWESPAVTHLLIDSIRAALNRNYIFPDTALKMSAYLARDLADTTHLAGRFLSRWDL